MKLDTRLLSLAGLLLLSWVKRIDASVTPNESKSMSHLNLDLIKTEGLQTIEYQAQTSRLMNLIVHSMYVNPEVFIRELLANACDAIDKLRRKAFGNAELTKEITEGGKVIVSIDKEAGTITFADSGIGMTKEELKENLGTIAKSGTAELLSKLKESKDASSLIGQFGVGFYSSFLVGNQVAVSSKSDDDPEQWVWISSADSPGFSIIKDPRGVTMKRGTEVTIKLKQEESRFLNQDEVKSHMQTYATYFPYPIFIQTRKTIEREVEEEGQEKVKEEEEKEAKVESGEEEEKKPAKKVIKEEIMEDVQVNSQKPLWLRDPKTVTMEEYNQMYRTVFKTNEDPLTHIQFSVEGDVSYKGILFVPKHAPFDIYSLKDAKTDVHLYVRRSFVTDKVDDILPVTLSFVKGIVDSDDLPLNISRETLQNTVALRSIKAKVVSKAIEMFKNLAEDPDRKEDWKMFQTNYSAHIKFEISRRENLRAKLAPLLRFETSKSEGKLASLDEYTDRKKDTQKHVYYLTGQSMNEVKRSPFMERMRDKDIEVIYSFDPIDEQMFKALHKYRDLTFHNIAQEGVKLEETEEEKAMKKEKTKEFEPLTNWLKKTLSKDIDKVVISDRLVKSPFAVVANQFGLTGTWKSWWWVSVRLGMRIRCCPSSSSQRKILEINPEHQTIKLMLQAVTKDADNADLPGIARALYDSAMITSGFTLHNPRRFANSVEKLAFKLLGEKYVEESVEEEPANPADLDIQSLLNMAKEHEEAMTEQASEHLQLKMPLVNQSGRIDSKWTPGHQGWTLNAHLNHHLFIILNKRSNKHYAIFEHSYCSILSTTNNHPIQINQSRDCWWMST